MKIIYKHKKTGYVISLDYIKSKPDYTIQLHDKWIARCEHAKTIEYPTTYEYYLRDIPLSDDFEMVVEDNPYDFDECEIYTLLNALNLYPYSTAHELKLKDKLVKIYKKLKGWD